MPAARSAARPPLPLLMAALCAAAALRDSEYDRRDPLQGRALRCPDPESRCLLEGKAWYPGDGRCHALWQRGPCPEHAWLVLDRAAALGGPGRLRAACSLTPERECPPGRVLMARDQRCLPRPLLQARVCGARGLALSYDVFGGGECAPAAAGPPLLPRPLPGRPGACVARRAPAVGQPLFAVRGPSVPLCALDDAGRCVKVASLPEAKPFDFFD